MSDTQNKLPPSAEEHTKRITGKGTKEDPWRYTDEFGIAYKWDDAKQVWASEEDLDTLIAKQQAAYEQKFKDEKKRKKEKKKKEVKVISSVFVQGLPLDITEDEFLPFFVKCGILKKDPETAKPKYKFYTNEEGKLTGEGLVTYFKPESVDLAIQLLDGAEIRPGHPVKVSKAVFDNKGPQDPSKKKAKPKKRSKKIKLYDQAKELGWEEDDNTRVVLKNMFNPREASKDENFLKDLEEDIRSECEKIGTIEKLKIFEKHPQGVVVILFEEHAAATRCVEKMNGRYFAGARIEAEFYDGWTDFKQEEIKDDEEEKRRLDAFGDWLENDD